MYALTTTNLKTLDSHTIRFDSLNDLPEHLRPRVEGKSLPMAFHRGGIYYNIKRSS